MTRAGPYHRSPPHRARHAGHHRPGTDPRRWAAAASRPAQPYRLRAHRTFGLLAVAGSALVGLSLIVGAIALVAEITALPSATHVTATASQKPSLRLAGGPGPGRAPGRAPAAGRPGVPASRLIAQFAGHGPARTGRFRVGGQRTWRIGWSYDCASLGRLGTFAVTVVGAGTPRATPVDQAGQRGQGVAPARAGPGTYQLAVSSGCAWTVRALADRPEARRHRLARRRPGGPARLAQPRLARRRLARRQARDARRASRRSAPWSGSASARRTRLCRLPAGSRPRAGRPRPRAGSA